MSRYTAISRAISRVCGIYFKAMSIRQYFPMVSGNKFKSYVGKENGVVRWKYFECEIESEGNLMKLLNDHECAQESWVYAITQYLKNTCAQAETRNSTTTLAHDSGFIDQFNNQVRRLLGMLRKKLKYPKRLNGYFTHSELSEKRQKLIYSKMFQFPSIR